MDLAIQELKEGLSTDAEADVGARIVRLLSERGRLSAAEIARHLGVAKSTVSAAVSELRKRELVVEASAARPAATGPGRPGHALSLNGRLGTCVGVQIGPRHMHLVVADVSHAIVADKVIEHAFDDGPREAAAMLRGEVERICADNALSFDTLLGVGLALPGPVAHQGDMFLRSSLLPRWAGTELREIFESAFERPIYAENESNCSAIAEMMWGAASDCDDFVFFKVDIGIGGAVVLNRRVVRGIAGAAGEFGHISVDPRGDLCECGNRGCVELRAGFRAVLRHAQPRFGPDITVERIIELALAGDAGCRRLIEDAAEAAGQGLAAVGAVLNPARVVVGGRVAAAGALLIDPLVASFDRHALVKRNEQPASLHTRIVPGAFPQTDACLGAVGLVLIRHGKLYSG